MGSQFYISTTPCISTTPVYSDFTFHYNGDHNAIWFPATSFRYLPKIKKVIFNDPATIVFWDDNTKTIVKCNTEKGDVFNKEHGLTMAIAKKALGNKGNFNNEIKKWIGAES